MQHRVHIRDLGGGFQAACSCGWAAEPWERQGNADLDGWRHAVEFFSTAAIGAEDGHPVEHPSHLEKIRHLIRSLLEYRTAGTLTAWDQERLRALCDAESELLSLRDDP